MPCRFLYGTVHTTFLSPELIPSVLVALRTTVFPGNTLGPPAAPAPTRDECLRLRRRAAESILQLIPPSVARIYFATDRREAMIDRIQQDVLDVFGDVYMNKHLVYGIIDLVVLRLVPELEHSTVSELLAERGVGLSPGPPPGGERGDRTID